MLIMRNLNLISVQSGTYLETMSFVSRTCLRPSLNVSRGVSGNIEVQGKQNSLFPKTSSFQPSMDKKKKIDNYYIKKGETNKKNI